MRACEVFSFWLVIRALQLYHSRDKSPLEMHNFEGITVLNLNTLWLYFLVTFGVVALPGMDMAYVMGSSIKGGLRSGLAAVAGTVVGGILHLTIGATGVAAVLSFMPWTFNLMLIGGALYIANLGLNLLRTQGAAPPAISPPHSSRQVTSTQVDLPMSKAFFGALATCMLNPKAYIFILAIFPQFVHPQSGQLWLQTAALSSITALTQIAVYGSLALLAARAHGSVGHNPRFNFILCKLMGIILILTAVFTMYSGLQLH